MKTELFSAQHIRNYLINKEIASIAELKKVLGTNVNKTVIRKLKTLSYRSSYSHRGKYYTLDEIIKFDSRELWSKSGVHFSKHGTLLETVKHFIGNSQSGLSALELDKILKVQTKETLLHLYKKKLIDREKVSGRFYYFSAKSSIKKIQYRLRKSGQDTTRSLTIGSVSDVSSDQIKAAILLFFCILDEKQRRLYAGIESMKLGHGGDQMISELLKIDVHTVSKGRKELVSGNIDLNRVRKAGGGRRKIKKKFLK